MLTHQRYIERFACNKAGVCRNESYEEAHFFDDYDLKYKKEEKVVKSGGSGTAVLLYFEKTVELESAARKTFSSLAMMKTVNSEKGKMADNLFHEGLVGLELNEIVSKFPCFIRTHGMFMESLDSPYVVNGTRYEKVGVPSIAESCLTAGHQAILLEYVEGVPLKDVFQKPEFVREAYSVMFQVYFALKLLGNKYTHYDLHMGNVMLTTVEEGKCVRFEYTMPGEENPIVFYGTYVAKIIDYGRNYVSSLKSEVEEIKTAKECNTPLCGRRGKECGYRNYQNPKHADLGFRRHNVSHDLRLLNYVAKALGSHWPESPHVVYAENEFSTSEVVSHGLPEEINNVDDAATFLATVVKKYNRKFKRVPLHGVMRVNGMEDWVYEPYNPSSQGKTRREKTRF